MDKIAFVIGDCIFGWYAVLMTMAVLTACAAFQLFFHNGRDKTAAGLWAVPLSLLLGFLLARMLHWYCRPNSYTDFTQAMTDYSGGDFALAGAFAGCVLTALLLRLLRISRNLPAMLDAMSLAGTLGIALGRPAFLFSTADHGMTTTQAWLLPRYFEVTNPVSGAVEYRLPTFALQGAFAAVLFLILVIVRIVRRKKPAGEVTLVFVLLYSCSQILLDSTRVDSLYFRSNGFVSVVQIVSVVAAAVVITIYSVRLIRQRGMHRELIPVWLLTALFIGGAAFMEYYVQRHGSEAVFAYSIMGVCLVCLACSGLLIRGNALRAEASRHS